MEEIENKIRNYGQRGDKESLEKYIGDLSTSELTEFITERLTSPNFVYAWNYLMQSFMESSNCHSKRFRVVMTLLGELEKEVIPETKMKDILIRLMIGFPRFKPPHLIELCNYCIECIQKGTVLELCWKEQLPQLLNALIAIEHVEHNEVEMTGLEYKAQLINSLCMMAWSPNNIISLTAMFIEMPLSKEEHLRVVNKLSSYMEKLTCQEIPAFVYQLLKLCRYQNSRSIFLRLQYYFGTRIYTRLNLNQEEHSEDAIGDAIDKDVVTNESTVLFHIHEAACDGHQCIRDYLTSLKNLLKSPEFMLHPFQFTVLLIISTVSDHEVSAGEILKTSITRALQEEQKKVNSLWMREIISSTSKILDIFQQIIHCCCISERFIAREGLIKLAYVLLGTNTLFDKEIVEKQWHLGKLIVLKILKTQRNCAHAVLDLLHEGIQTEQNVFQYIECVRAVVQKMPLLMLENQNFSMALVQDLVELPGNVAGHLFEAILPLTKMSPTIRDHLIMILRKGLFSRNNETRQMAVSSFLKLIKNLKISNLATLSQSSSSSSRSSVGLSVFTQVSLTYYGTARPSVFSNEALCLEVLGILRRCFMQHADVRGVLYNGLYDAVCMNVELGIPVLDLIWLHFRDLYVNDEESLPPLLFSKISTTKESSVTLQEPLGKLLYSVGLVLMKVSEENEEHPTVIKFSKVMESLTSRMINCELIHLELDDGTDLLDVLPKSQHKLMVLNQAILVYEALIGYKISTWCPRFDNNGQHISSLFQGYSRLLDFSKNLMKSKKGKKSTKGGGNKSTQPSQDTTNTENGQKSKTFKLPKTVLDFQAVGKILHLLHKPQVAWATAAQANIIKVKPAIHQRIMQIAIELISSVKQQKTSELKHDKLYYNYIIEIAGILWERCINRLNEFMEFDSTTAILAVECFHLILVVASTHFKEKLPVFLAVVVGNSKDDEIEKTLTVYFETYKQLFENADEKSTNDVEIKKLPLLVINSLSLLSTKIPSETNVLSIQLLDWIKTFMNNNTLPNKQVIVVFINMAFGMQIKFKSSVNLFETIALRLSDVIGTINEQTSNTEEPKLIDERSAITIFPLLCNAVKTLLDDVDWIVMRLRAEYGMITYPGEDQQERRREYLKSKERGVCCQLCPIIQILNIMCNLTISPGYLTEALLKVISHLYLTLNSLTKYFILRSSKINVVFQGARFERVVTLAGKRLSSVIYDFVMYMEECQNHEVKNIQGKKKALDKATLKSKVLKETRLIPKTIYDMEQFAKSIMQLSKKTNLDLTKLVGQGTVRDFRIKQLTDVLEEVEGQNDTTHDDSTALDENESNMDVSADKENEEEDDAGTSLPPPAKKKKN